MCSSDTFLDGHFNKIDILQAMISHIEFMRIIREKKDELDIEVLDYDELDPIDRIKKL